MKNFNDMLNYIKNTYKNAVYLVDGSTLLTCIKPVFASLDDVIFLKDYIGIGDSASEILSDEFLHIRAKALSFPAFKTYTSDEYEVLVASELRKLPEKFANKDHIVLIQWGGFLSEIWRLTIQAYIEQLKLAKEIVLMRVNAALLAQCAELNITGSRKAYLDLVCNRKKIDLSKFEIPEEAVDFYLDLNSKDGKFGKYILSESVKHNNPHIAYSVFLQDFKNTGLDDIDFIKMAYTLLSQYEEHKKLCKTWKRKCNCVDNY